MIGAALGGGEVMLIALILAIGAVVPLAIGLFAFWIWMLIDCINNKGLTSNEKIAWILVIVLTHWLGALIYLLAGRSKRPEVPAQIRGNNI